MTRLPGQPGRVGSKNNNSGSSRGFPLHHHSHTSLRPNQLPI